MATTEPAAPATASEPPKPTESTASALSKPTDPTTSAPPKPADLTANAPPKPTEPTATASSANPTPPASSSGAESKGSTLADTKPTTGAKDAETPPFSPGSTTPVLEKDELDFAGNVDVNDDLPTAADLKRVGDLLLLDSQGVSRPFKELYQGVGVAPRQLIIFVRHFFCGNCQEYLRTLSSSITPESLLALPTPTFITVIGCGRPELIDMYVQTTSCPFPVYADPTHKLYDYLGMTRTLNLGKKPNYIHSNLFVTSVQSIVQSLKTGDKALKGGDLKQVGGEFLFEHGEVKWVHRMRNTRDHSEVEDIRRVLGLDDTKPPMRKRWSHGIKDESTKRSSSWGRVRSKSKAKKESLGSATVPEKMTAQDIKELEEDEKAKEEDRKLATRPTV